MLHKDLIDVSSLDYKEINSIFSYAKKYLKKPRDNFLKDKTLINLFFENSTRTRSSFEIAAKNMGASVINIDVSSSSLKKGESEKDTIMTLNAMGADYITIRHSEAGMVERLAKYSDARIINSGDGAHAHPTQALLDVFTIAEFLKIKNLSEISKLKVAICGDIINSRVARSNINLLEKLGAKVNLVGPITLLPEQEFFDNKNIKIFDDIKKGVKDVDVIITLRIQKERMKNLFSLGASEYNKFYAINNEIYNLAKKNALILHPGPVNRDVEISSDLVDNDKICMILDQVKNGVAIRQALLRILK